MKKTTKIFSLLLAVVFCFSLMSMTLFATDYYKVESTEDVIEGYYFEMFARFDADTISARAYTQLLCISDDAEAITAITQCHINLGYADGSYGYQKVQSNEYTIYGWGDGILISNSLDYEKGKLIGSIFTSHVYLIDGMNPYVEYVDLFVGVDFPQVTA